MDLSDLRREYSMGGLDRGDLVADPLDQFERWFAQATSVGRWRRISIAFYKLWQAILGRSGVDANAMSLATVDGAGWPSSRTVLLKAVDKRGFIFFTNYDSRKGRELEANPNAALTFYWRELERQVCVAGTVQRLPKNESETYFKTRPRGSRLAAWASNQSDVAADRDALNAKWDAMAKRFPDEIPLPPNWGGYVLDPIRIEFWQGRPSRFHDRFRYSREAGNSWKVERLEP